MDKEAAREIIQAIEEGQELVGLEREEYLTRWEERAPAYGAWLRKVVSAAEEVLRGRDQDHQ